MARLSRAEAAAAASVNIETLRYYERRGLIPKPPRTASNYRSYPEDTVRQVRFIKGAQALGFALEEIRELLSLRTRPASSCRAVRERASAKVTAIDERIDSLKAMRSALRELVEHCSGDMPMAACSILNALELQKGLRP